MTVYSALVVVADGSEEIEFSASLDILARAGFHVTTASVMSSVGGTDHRRLSCTLSRGMKVEADHTVSEIIESHAKNFDVIVVPGGMPGAKHCADSSELISMLKEQKARGGWYAAICASPAVVFRAHNIVSNEKMVCYDYKDFNEALIAGNNMGKGRVCVSGKCITSVGPSSAIDFALAIVECIVGKHKADELAKDLMMIDDRVSPVIC